MSLPSKQPEVAIITPFRNAACFIDQYCLMLQAQVYSNWVCLLVDDYSTDASVSLLEPYLDKDSRFQLLHSKRNSHAQSTSGPSYPRNSALDYVSSPLTAFCDIDDLWHPEKLAVQVNYHLSHSLAISTTAYARFQDHPSSRIFSLKVPPSSLEISSFYGPNPIPMLTVLVNTQSISHLRFKPAKHEDHIFWTEYFRGELTPRYGCVPLLLGFYRVHPHNLTSNRLLMIRWAIGVFSLLRLNSIEFCFAISRWFISHLMSTLYTLTIEPKYRLSVEELMARPPLHAKPTL